jgi:acyl-homoserine-lactone acylase
MDRRRTDEQADRSTRAKLLRTKADRLRRYRKVAELQANFLPTTIFADDKGEIAYLHPQFIPKRDDRFDYTRPVDGSDPQPTGNGLHALDEAPHVLNPANGWLFNTNTGPYSAAGRTAQARRLPTLHGQLRREPARDPRMRVLGDRDDFTCPR